MAKTLYLVRHAQAGESDNQKDFDRPLTPVGARDARHLGRRLFENHHAIDHLISSKALRARTTSEIIAEEMKLEHLLTYNDELYEASVRTMLSIVNELSDAVNAAMIIGHNPTVTYLADYLTEAPLNNMVPGSFVIIKFESNNWTEITQYTGQFIAYKSPLDPDSDEIQSE